jgi:hypothetical protein
MQEELSQMKLDNKDSISKDLGNLAILDQSNREKSYKIKK